MKYLKSVLTGIALSAPVLFVVYQIINVPQCPTNATQAQVDATQCVVGANIGLSVLIVIAPVVLCASIIIAHTFLISNLKKS